MNTQPVSSSRERRQGFLTWVVNGLRWRLEAYLARSRRSFWHLSRRILGVRETGWANVVMDRETEEFVRSLNCSSWHALEISGTRWQDFGFASYRNVSFPEYDICEGPLEQEAFDIVIAEQVLEHVLWPYRAVRNVWKMLRPGGVFVATTPFLIPVYDCPVDCSRWTELGLKHLLAEGGFELGNIITASWGNSSCVRADLRLRGLKFSYWVPWKHSLRNEPYCPVVVWAFARKAD